MLKCQAIRLDNKGKTTITRRKASRQLSTTVDEVQLWYNRNAKMLYDCGDTVLAVRKDACTLLTSQAKKPKNLLS